MQIKLYSKLTKIYINRTCKLCPKNFYQILNIIGKIKNENINFPLIQLIMSDKSEYSYNRFFSEIKMIIYKYYDYNIFNNITFMSDFEKGLKNSIKTNFPKSNHVSCFFHNIKNISFIKRNNKYDYFRKN